MISKEKINKTIFIIGVILLVIFPKGGIKISGIPITWGYFFLGIVSIFAFLKILIITKLKISNNSLLMYFLALPFQIYAIVSFFLLGVVASKGDLISFIVNFSVFPILFYILFNDYFKSLKIDTIKKNLLVGVNFVIIYGLFLFVYKYVTGKFFTIPYITVNIADYLDHSIETGKYNSRGSVFKLFSTYNNGNIFGVSMLILTPFYFANQKSKLKIILFIIALFLTLSRTVWIGIILFFLIKYRRKVFSLIGLYMLIFFIVFCIGILFLNVGASRYKGIDSFLLDKNLGGRFSHILEITPSFFSDQPFKWIREIIYLSIFDEFGFLGLVLFLLFFLTPILLGILKFRKLNSLQKEFLFGVILYSIICWSDGAILLIPVLVFYYFCCSIILIDYGLPFLKRVEVR